MRFLMIIGGLLLFAFAGLTLAGFALPREATAERTIVIDADASEIFPYVADYSKFDDWSPWTELDPDMKTVIDGEPETVGHRSAWESENKNVGSGAQTIVEIDPGRRVCSLLEFDGQGEANACFDLSPVEGGTAVRWSFKTDLGGSPFPRLFGPMIESAVPIRRMPPR